MRNHTYEYVVEDLEDSAKEVFKRVQRGLSPDVKELLVTYLIGLPYLERAEHIFDLIHLPRKRRKANICRVAASSIIDKLTQVYNRSGFVPALEAAFQTVDRLEHRSISDDTRKAVPFPNNKRENTMALDVTLCLLDIDHFKSVNDDHGHPKGDEILAQVAGYIKKTVRQQDQQNIYRLGGEEFAVILPYTSPEQGLRIANRIRTTIAGELSNALPERGITASLGVGNYKGTLRESNPHALYTQVDIALYAAKQHGRNCVKLYTPSLEEAYHAVKAAHKKHII